MSAITHATSTEIADPPEHHPPANAPNFFIPGASKSGTTALYNYLNQHPQIYFPDVKEPHFFNHPETFDHSFERYLTIHFDGAHEYPLRGDASPAMFRNPDHVIPRLRQVFGDRDPKLIFLLRDPVDRAWSHYLYQVARDLEDETFQQALDSEERRRREDPNHWGAYRTEGEYAPLLRKWLDEFSRENILVLLSHDLKERTEREVHRAFRFLGVEPLDDLEPLSDNQKNTAFERRWRLPIRLMESDFWLKRRTVDLLDYFFTPGWQSRIRRFFSSLNRKRKSDKPDLPAEQARRLRKHYRPHIEDLEDLLDRDLSAWK